MLPDPRFICTNGNTGEHKQFYGEEIAAAIFLMWVGKDKTPDGRVNSKLQEEMVYALLLTGRLIDGNISVIDRSHDENRNTL